MSGSNFVVNFGKMKFFSRIFSLFLAVAFLMATTGFSVYKHYCGDYLVDTSLYSSNQICTPDHSEKECTIQKKDCCTDEFHFVQLDVDLKNPEWKSQSPKLPAVLVSFYSNFLLKSFLKIDQFSLGRVDQIPIGKAEPIYILQQKLVYYG